MNMDQLGQDSGRGAEYITLLKGVSPLAWTSFVIALAVGLYGMRLRNLLRSWVQLVVTVINMLLYSAITSVMAVSAVMLLPYVISDPSRELELGVLIMVSLFGIQAFVILAQRVFGPSADRFLDATFLGTVRSNMTPEQCREHADLCPFHHEHEERAKNGRNEKGLRENHAAAGPRPPVGPMPGRRG